MLIYNNWIQMDLILFEVRYYIVHFKKMITEIQIELYMYIYIQIKAPEHT